MPDFPNALAAAQAADADYHAALVAYFGPAQAVRERLFSLRYGDARMPRHIKALRKAKLDADMVAETAYRA